MMVDERIFFDFLKSLLTARKDVTQMNPRMKVCALIVLALSLILLSTSGWADETDLIWSTFLGGSGWDPCYPIAVDDSGNSYVSGSAESADFPVTAGAFDGTYNGGGDAFMAKFNLGELVPVESETPIVGLPNSYALHQNYPKPFNANTEIRYQIPQGGNATLKVFNTLGQEVRTLVNGSQEAGRHAIAWDGRDNNGWEVSTGMYLCWLQAGEFSKTIKMVLIK